MSVQPFCEPAPVVSDPAVATVCQIDPPVVGDCHSQLGCNTEPGPPVTFPIAGPAIVVSTLPVPGDDCMEGGLTRWSFQPCVIPSDNQWTEVSTARTMPVTGAAETSAMCGLALMCVVGGVALVRWVARR